jgi:hypothetical protein
VRLPERRDRERHQSRSGRRKRGHPQPADAHAQHGCKIGLSSVDLGEDRLGVFDQLRPGGGRANPLAVAHHEHRAGLRLEPRDRL